MFRLTNGETLSPDHIDLGGREFFADRRIYDNSAAGTLLGWDPNAIVRTHIFYDNRTQIILTQRHEDASLLLDNPENKVDTFEVSVVKPHSDDPVYQKKVWSGAWILPLPFYEKRAARALGTAEKIAKRVKPVSTLIFID